MVRMPNISIILCVAISQDIVFPNSIKSMPNFIATKFMNQGTKFSLCLEELTFLKHVSAISIFLVNERLWS